MTPDQFFAKFALLSETPNAVAKMRELIRTFAVRGKLVAQDYSEEPAQHLVTRVTESLPRRLSGNPFLAEIGHLITLESEYELPDGWAWIPLGHVGLWATGCGFPVQFQGMTNRDFLFCKVSDMNLPGNEIEIRTTANSVDSSVMQTLKAHSMTP